MQQPFTLTRQQVRELDRRAMDEYGLPGLVLMENAGRGCAELLMRLNSGKKPTVILCGPGNNGGDGFVMARYLDNHGWPVIVWDVSGDGGSGDLNVNRRVAGLSRLIIRPDDVPVAERHPIVAAQLHRRGKASEDDPFSPINCSTWVVDALFGTGLSRRLDGQFAELVEAVNHGGGNTLAIDIPSGLDCDTGEPLGPTVRATHTATFVAPKRGFLNPKSCEWTGEVHVIDIGAPRKLVDEYRS